MLSILRTQTIPGQIFLTFPPPGPILKLNATLYHHQRFLKNNTCLNKIEAIRSRECFLITTRSPSGSAKNLSRSTWPSLTPPKSKVLLSSSMTFSSQREILESMLSKPTPSFLKTLWNTKPAATTHSISTDQMVSLENSLETLWPMSQLSSLLRPLLLHWYSKTCQQVMTISWSTMLMDRIMMTSIKAPNTQLIWPPLTRMDGTILLCSQPAINLNGKEHSWEELSWDMRESPILPWLSISSTMKRISILNNIQRWWTCLLGTRSMLARTQDKETRFARISASTSPTTSTL